MYLFMLTYPWRGILNSCLLLFLSLVVEQAINFRFANVRDKRWNTSGTIIKHCGDTSRFPRIESLPSNLPFDDGTIPLRFPLRKITITYTVRVSRARRHVGSRAERLGEGKFPRIAFANLCRRFNSVHGIGEVVIVGIVKFHARAIHRFA